MSATFDPRAAELEGSSTYTLCDAIEDHPRGELARTVLAARSLIATSAKMKRYQSVLQGPRVDPEKHRATRALEVSTVDQLLRWAGEGMEPGERRRLLDAAFARAAEGIASARPLDALLETATDEDKRAWIASAPPLKDFDSHPWASRALAGEDEPGATLVTQLSMSRRAPVEWARALVAQRRRFASDLAVDLRSQRDDGATREALELLAHGQLAGVTLERRKDQAGFAAFADSLPEGLRRLSLAWVAGEDVAAFAARSSLRSIESLSISTRQPCLPAVLALLRALDSLRSLELRVGRAEAGALKSLAEAGALRSVEALGFSGPEQRSEDVAAALRGCSALRSVELGDIELSAADARELAASPTLSKVESARFRSSFLGRGSATAIDAFASALRCEGLRRFHWKTYTADASRIERALGAMADNSSFATLRDLALDGVAPASAPKLRALLDSCELDSCELSLTGGSAEIFRAIAESNAARSLRALSFDARSMLWPEGLAPLCESGLLSGLESLSLSPQEVTAAMVNQLAASSIARSLSELTMYSDRCGPGVARALCESGLASSLSRLTIPYRFFDDDELWLLKRSFGPALYLM